MHRHATYGFALLILLAAGCPPKPERAAATASSTPVVWGGLSEKEFKALHTLTGAEAPARQGELIDIAGARAYLSLPGEAKPPIAGVVVIHEWWGLNEHIMHWTDRLAAAGYAAVAVDLYGGVVATSREEAMRAMKSVDPDEAARVLNSAHAFLAEDDRIRARKRGVIGWCFGGAWSLQHALAAENLDAAVIYYGRLVSEPEELRKIEAAVLGIFGNQDQGIPPSAVDQFDAALDAAQVSHEIHRYDAPHAFANPSSDRYDPDSATDAWSHVQAFLSKHLGP